VNVHHIQLGPPSDVRGMVTYDGQRGHSLDCYGMHWHGKENWGLKKISKKLTTKAIDVSRAAQNLRQWDLT